MTSRQRADLSQACASLDDGWDDEPELTGLAEHLRDEGTHADYMREAYGDPCPGCKGLRWGGDCPNCFDDSEGQFDTLEEKRGER